MSLITFIGKVLEHIVTALLNFYLESRCLLSSAEFGFRKTHNMEERLWNFVSVASIAVQSRKCPIMLSLDIQSAYNRIWHTGLI